MTTQQRTLEVESLFYHSERIFGAELKTRLNLKTISSPLFVSSDSGLNDDLNGIENAVSFTINDQKHEIVHSLAKWKRWILGEMKTEAGKGIVTHMKAIRKDEVLSPIHSHLVEQWDWEKVIRKDERNLETLIEHAKLIYRALQRTEIEIAAINVSAPTLPAELHVIQAEDLLQLYPKYTPKQREDAITAKFGAVLIVGIGNELSNGSAHDLRAPDYDDWTSINSLGYPGLNADLLVWDSMRKSSLEISSMGIRVDKLSLLKQLEKTNTVSRITKPFHQMVVTNQLPFTIGGGIGKSRVVMFVNKKKDIKEVLPKTELVNSSISMPLV